MARGGKAFIHAGATIARPLWRHVLVGALAYGTAAATAFAQPATPATTPTTAVVQFNGSIVQLPTNMPASRRSGLRISIDPRWTNTYGYCPVEVTISSPLGAMKVDRAITVKLRVGWGRVVTVEQEFILPAGATSVTAKMSVPIYQPAQSYYSWDVWVDGVKDKDLSLDVSAAYSYASPTTTSSGTAVRFLAAAPQSKHRSLVGTTSTDVEVLSLELSAFPKQWIDYTSLDVVSLTVAEANQLAASNPAAFEAIGRWARAGGQVWIYEVGNELEYLPEVSKLWHLSEKMVADDAEGGSDEETKSNSDGDKADAKPKEKDVQPAMKEGWTGVRIRRFPGDGQVATFLDPRNGMRRRARGADSIARLQNDPSLVKTEERADSTGDNGGRRLADSSPWFVEQAYGLGKVRAYRGGNDVGALPMSSTVANATTPGTVNSSDTPDELPQALAIGLRRAQRWDTRHGMTPDSANTEFARFLVPGVGMAPVTYFQVLITLFVLLIGPANYWFLKRVKKVHLMVLTVPLAAGITTLALFAYAILADGFATRVRADSFTTLDQRTGEAACWSRLSYYSGLAPGNGLVMPADVALYPIMPSWAGDLDAWEQREMVWDDGKAELKQGWLNSRTPTQYLTIRARKSPHQIELLESEEKLRAKNQLGTPIKTLLAINSAGKYYLGEGIGIDGTAMLKTISRDDAVRIINKQVVDNTPQAPAELAVGESDVYALRARARYGPWRYGLQPNSGKLSENLASSALSSLAGLSGQPGLELPPRSYVAITETGAEVELGMSSAKEEASFHVIEGRW